MTITRSENMRRIRSVDTKPEMVVRRLLRQLGFPGYRTHRSDLPGRPDIAYIGRRKAILVHGCFWHGHSCKVGSRKPKSNLSYWIPKIQRNKTRDAMHIRKFYELGWKVLTIWECEIKNSDALALRIDNFMKDSPDSNLVD